MSNEAFKTQVIHLLDYFPVNISTRQAVVEIQKKFDSNAEKIILDFLDIDFVSRSACHQLLRLASQEKKIEFKNLNSTIEAIFNLVKTARRANTKPLPVAKVTTLEETYSLF